MLLLEVSGEQSVLCPLFPAGEDMRHRADLQPAWCELIEANLKNADVKVRCVPQIHPVVRLKKVGRVGANLTYRVRSEVLREQARRTCELALERGTRGYARVGMVPR